VAQTATCIYTRAEADLLPQLFGRRACKVWETSVLSGARGQGTGLLLI